MFTSSLLLFLHNFSSFIIFVEKSTSISTFIYFDINTYILNQYYCAGFYQEELFDFFVS